MTRLTTRRRRRAAGAAVVAAVLAAGTALLPPGAASALPGPAPESSTRTVITDTHVDVVSAGVAADRLTFHTKADLERPGTRLYPGDVIVNVEDAARTTAPDDPAYAFLGATGSEVWVAPETRQAGVVWPGFDTGDVPAGAVAGPVGIALTAVTGPGRVEVWSESGAGPERIFSSQAGGVVSNVLELPAGAHRHASWGFTAAGRYHLTFEVRALVGGVPHTTAATVRFHVGAVPAAAGTSTSLTAQPDLTVAGRSVTLTAAVSPGDANGAVEFLAGDTVLGHAAVAGGTAVLETAQIPVGRQPVIARFVPAWTDEFEPSAAAPVTVNVRQPGATADFEITGLRESYESGDILRLGVAGYTLGAGQSVRWLARSPDPRQEPVTLGDVTGPDPLSLERVLTTAYDGWELRAQIRTGAAVDATTAPVRLSVGGSDAGSGEPITIAPIETDYYWGVAVPLVATHRTPAPGETLHWVERVAVGAVAWEATHPTYGPVGDGPWSVVSNFMQYKEFALQLRAADGTVLGQSAPLRYDLAMRTIDLEGLRDLYRVGERAGLSASVSPDLGDGLRFVWELWQGGGDRLSLDGGAALPAVEFEVTEAMQNRTLYLLVYSRTTDQLVGYVTAPFNVTTAGAGDQVLTMAAVDGHYHTGTPVLMDLTADPPPASSDVIRFWWRRSDWSEFRQIPGTRGMSHAVIAEQALDGTEIKADLVNSAGEVLAATATQTIHVDDHGAPPPQGVVVEGVAASYEAGDTAVLTARVSPSSVLSRYEWLVQPAGAAEPVAVDGANGPRLELPVTAGLDGATVTARLTFDDGRPYVTSLPATLNVDGGDPGPGEPSQRVVARLPEGEGALVVSVHPGDDTVTMSDFELGVAGDHWSSTGDLRPVTVTDTRASAPGWVVSAQAGDFTADDEVLSGGALGWTPLVTEQPGDGGVVPGAAVPPDAPGSGAGGGLSVSSPLAVAAPGAGHGTSRLGAALLIEAPTTLVPDTYRATITFTAI